MGNEVLSEIRARIERIEKQVGLPFLAWQIDLVEKHQAKKPGRPAKKTDDDN